MRAEHDVGWAMLAGLLFAAAAATPASAQNEPVLVVPGRPGVPVMMYGVDVSGAVIEGEFGLNRPGQIAPTVIMPYASPALLPLPGAYFPATGQRPRYGRLEVIPPNRRGPQAAEPFFRAWGIESMPTPATEPAPYPPPAIVVAPGERKGHRVAPHVTPSPKMPQATPAPAPPLPKTP